MNNPIFQRREAASATPVVISGYIISGGQDGIGRPAALRAVRTMMP